ncbi:SGNH/GDSL hydrolase family protein [Bacillus sp. JJ1562]|uniref:SGNH/GDSL hydrolase family protein n=1 Tax=Bacillus sp. JJ1562 TaxID=3122960 RepID=UPI0030034615
MKKLLLIIITIAAIGSVIAGKIHWDQKIATSTKVEVKSEKIEKEKPKSEPKVAEDDTRNLDEIMGYTKNLPADVITKVETSVNSEKSLTFVIMGSASTPIDPDGWPMRLKGALEQSYGKDVMNVIIEEIPDKTSLSVIQDNLYEDVIELKPDVLLLEPFILIDNGLVAMSDRLANLQTIINDFKAANSDISLFIQPANPLLKAKFYPREVEELKRFAESNHYTYLDHWTAWPDHQTDEIAEYLEDSLPNEEGHELWANYLIEYFTGLDY